MTDVSNRFFILYYLLFFPSPPRTYSNDRYFRGYFTSLTRPLSKGYWGSLVSVVMVIWNWNRPVEIIERTSGQMGTGNLVWVLIA